MKKAFHLLAALLLLAATGCSESSPDAPAEDSAHPASWTDPRLHGTPAFHAAQVEAEGPEECQACHGPDYRGSEDIPGCFKCHFGPTGLFAPAGSAWVHPDQIGHDPFLGAGNVCNECHGIFRAFGLPPAACHDCHGAGLNHPLGQPWLDKTSAQFHGLGPDTATCAACHDLPVFCSQCHFGPTGSMVPPGTGWTHGLGLHQNYPAFEVTCNQCHNLDRSFGLPPAACHDCHGTGLNHPLGQPWLDKTSAEFHGLGPPDTATCSACHDINVFCSQCHFGPTGSMVPPGTGWNHGQGQHENYEAFLVTCNACHDVNRRFGLPLAACHDCHGPGP